MNAPLASRHHRVPLRSQRYVYSPDMIPGFYRVLDIILILTCALVTSTLAPDVLGAELKSIAFSVVFYGLVFYAFANWARLYGVETLVKYGARTQDLLIVNVTTVMLLLSVIFAFRPAQDGEIEWLVGVAAISFLSQTIARFAGCYVLRRLAARRAIGRNVAVIGQGEQAARFLRRIERAQPFFIHVVGVFDIEALETPGKLFEGKPVVGGLDDLLAAVRAHEVDEVVVALPWAAYRDVSTIVERLKELPINVYLSTDLVGFELAFHPVTGDLADLPLFEVIQRPISGWSRTLKAGEDYVLATLIVLALAPLLLLIAVAVKLDSPGPVFFKQRRLGFNNQEFEIYKFRSMYHGRAPEATVRQAQKGDPRITRVGRIIRRTSLDELPQFFNVLNGTMSLVGPRPHAVAHNEEYSRKIRGYFARHNVKPGITGWAQVNGLRGETETIDKMEARIRHDIYYAENWSILFDLRILVQTAMVVLFQKTAY